MVVTRGNPEKQYQFQANDDYFRMMAQNPNIIQPEEVHSITDKHDADYVNVINSFTANLIRRWCDENDAYYGELCVKQSAECFLKYQGTIETFSSVAAIEKKLAKLKNTHICIVKSMCSSKHGGKRYYTNHWYFQTPLSPSRPELNEKITLSNSYGLGWQVEKSDQFCMVYAFFGALQKEEFWKKHRANPYFYFKQVPDVKNCGLNLANRTFGNEVQNENTVKLMTFLLDFVDKHSELCKQTIQDIHKKMPKGVKGIVSKRKRKYDFAVLRKTIQDAKTNPRLVLPVWNCYSASAKSKTKTKTKTRTKTPSKNKTPRKRRPVGKKDEK